MSTSRVPLLTLLLASPVVAGVSFRPVALSDAPAPGLPAGTVFAFFSDPRVNSAGHVAFWAELAGPGVNANNAGSIWSDRSGAMALVARTTDPAPGIAATAQIAMPGPAFNDAGRMAWPATLVPDTLAIVPVNIGLCAEDSHGVLTLVAREGEDATGLEPAVFSNLTSLSLDQSGRVYWQGNAGAAAWEASPGGVIRALAVRGQAAPGAPGATFDYIDAPAVGSAGAAVVRSTLSGVAGVLSGLWDVSGAAPVAIAIAGSAAPGGSTFQDFDTGAVACAADCVAFYARLAETPAPVPGVWAGARSGPALLARAGDPAPGTLDTFATILAHPAVSPQGHVAFLAHVGASGEFSAALCATDAGAASLRLMARENEQAPGLPPGVRFASFSTPALNDAGQLAFLARLRGPGVTMTSSVALYATDRTGRLRALVRTGDVFDTWSGLKTVEDIRFHTDPASAGHSSFAAVANAGDLVFELTFKDTVGTQVVRASGIFKARIGCLADIDDSGDLNVADFTAMLQAFAAGDLRTVDFNANGHTDVGDFTGFLFAFAAGCP